MEEEKVFWKEEVYKEALLDLSSGAQDDLERAARLLASIRDYKDAAKLLEETKGQMMAAQARKQRQEKQEGLQNEVRSEMERFRRQRGMKIALIAGLTVLALVMGTLGIIGIRRGQLYGEAGEAMDAQNYKEAVTIYERLGDYRDCPDLLKEAQYEYGLQLIGQGQFEDGYDWLRRCGTSDALEALSESQYLRGLSALEKGEYKEAVELLEAAGDYQDAASHLADAYFGYAGELERGGKYEEAYRIWEDLGSEAAREAITASYYHRAVAAFDAGEYKQAEELFSHTEGYGDTASYIRQIYLLIYIKPIDQAAEGDLVHFGTFEQDNDVSNGKEDIEWIVLARKEDRVLLISRQVLDYRVYDPSYEQVHWESSELRRWLAEDFASEAFSEAQRGWIIPVTNPNPDSTGLLFTEPEEDTEDTVFLLSVNEALLYFKDDDARAARYTAYAAAKSSSALLKEENWRTRSAGDLGMMTGMVNSYGAVMADGGFAFMSAGVRPAVWVRLNP